MSIRMHAMLVVVALIAAAVVNSVNGAVVRVAGPASARALISAAAAAAGDGASAIDPIYTVADPRAAKDWIKESKSSFALSAIPFRAVSKFFTIPAGVYQFPVALSAVAVYVSGTAPLKLSTQQLCTAFTKGSLNKAPVTIVKLPARADVTRVLKEYLDKACGAGASRAFNKLSDVIVEPSAGKVVKAIKSATSLTIGYARCGQDANEAMIENIAGKYVRCETAAYGNSVEVEAPKGVGPEAKVPFLISWSGIEITAVNGPGVNDFPTTYALFAFIKNLGGISQSKRVLLEILNTKGFGKAFGYFQLPDNMREVACKAIREFDPRLVSPGKCLSI